MGMPMAQNLLSAGFQLKIYNRIPSKAAPLTKQGAEIVEHPGDLLFPDSVVITMVADDHALEEIVFGPHGIAEKLGNGNIHISMSTISPELSQRLSEDHRKRGGHFLSATVSGRPEAAAAKKLWIYLAGEDSAKRKATPFLQALGQHVYDVGSDPVHANIIKLCVNFLLFSAVEGLGETFAFAKKNGVSPELIAHIFGESMFGCPAYQIYGKIVSTEDYKAGFHLDLGMKDIRLLRSAAEESRVPLPLANLLYQRLLTAMAKGRDALDWSAIALSSFEDAHIETPFLKGEKK